MKAVILLGTLKKEGLSNTEVLSEFLSSVLKEHGIDCTIIKLVEHTILPGTYSNMGSGDQWPGILQKVLESDIIILATPIWWNNQSSEIQKVIERLDELHDEILEGQESRLSGKTGGIVITGDSDGAQHIIANISNFYNAIGILLPPFATLSVLWEKQKKSAETTREELMAKYKTDYSATAKKMVEQLKKYSKQEKEA
ncbi:flavodoxin family protein [Pontibacter sp. BT310]|uniref:NAD(P)H-dependent oxidoreductase n=1 Tax=Pontibacter populi TaxID=890055 RepID=A0ABS6XB92_9BACT|nr:MULTISPECIES: NAD(P)H-dependent oxidoreductase [Pontibacter]MBJ6118406.1 flavodoxin family protein [Pontibacter sp. BT310]MBR0570834.1 flavodoxin family protein [Microvirga sp. STS03]MBW3365260.1 NAD(P)H-dependent oxidoreductase [Pontibacter populi]